MSDDGATSEQALRELAERLMRRPHPDGPTSAEIFVGSLPEGLALDVPIPAESTLLGSRLKRLSGRPASMEAVFESDREPVAVVAAYTVALRATGWINFDRFGPRRGGFLSAGRGESVSMWRNGQPPALMLSAAARDGEPTDVRLVLNWESVRRLPAGRGASLPGADLVPQLRAPRGAAVGDQSGGGGERYWTQQTTVHTEQGVADLEDHFSAQLERAGWTRIARGAADEFLACSSWTVPGAGGWRGLLLILAPFGGDERELIVRIDRPEADET